MRGVWKLFGLSGVGDKPLDSCHSGGSSAPGPNAAAWSCPVEQQISLQRLDKAAWLPGRKEIGCLKQSVWMLPHPSPFLLPGHVWRVINNTEKTVGSALEGKCCTALEWIPSENTTGTWGLGSSSSCLFWSPHSSSCHVLGDSWGVWHLNGILASLPWHWRLCEVCLSSVLHGLQKQRY